MRQPHAHLFDWQRPPHCLGWFQGSLARLSPANDLYWSPRGELTYVNADAAGLAIGSQVGSPQGA